MWLDPTRLPGLGGYARIATAFQAPTAAQRLRLERGGKMSQDERMRLAGAGSTEADLLASVRDGDMAAFTELVSLNRGPAMMVARSIVDAATADDVVADVFERLWVVLRKGQGPRYSLRPYLLQMVRNRAIDSLRRRNEIPVESIGDGAEPGVEDADSRVVRIAFEALPQRWQTALWLGVVESCSHAEIGRELKVGEGAATQLLHRAREGLRQSYLDAQIGPDEECERLSGLFGSYVRGRSGLRNSRKVAAHLEECESCRAALAKTQQLNSRLGAVLVVGLVGGVGLELLRPPAGAVAVGVGAQLSRGLGKLKSVGSHYGVGLAVAGGTLTVAVALGISGFGGGGEAEANLVAASTPSVASTGPNAPQRPSSPATAPVAQTPQPTLDAQPPRDRMGSPRRQPPAGGVAAPAATPSPTSSPQPTQPPTPVSSPGASVEVPGTPAPWPGLPTSPSPSVEMSPAPTSSPEPSGAPSPSAIGSSGPLTAEPSPSPSGAASDEPEADEDQVLPRCRQSVACAEIRHR